MDKTSDEYRQLEKEYEFLSNLINNYRSSSSAPKGCKILPRKSSISVTKDSRSSQYVAGISHSKRQQHSWESSRKNKPLDCLGAPETNSQQTSKQNLQTLDTKIRHGNQSHAVNKYKLVRPGSDNSLNQVQSFLPRGSQPSQAPTGSKTEKPAKLSSLSCNSTKLLNASQSTKDVIHKSKYKLVRTECGRSDASLTKLKLSAQNLAKTSYLCNGKSSFVASQTRLAKVPSNLVTSPNASSSRIVKKNVLTGFERNHQQLRKSNGFPVNSLLLNGQIVKNNRFVNQYSSSFLSPFLKRPKASWNAKYSLQRRNGDVSKNENCINSILGRKISNLSFNKYKFINAKPTQSAEPLGHYVAKKKRFKFERVTRIRPPARKWSYADLRHPAKKRKVLQRRSSVNLSGDASVRFCLYYNRFGRCSRGDRCHYVHDPDKISVCTRFLRGTCKVTDCPFSHNVAKHKMPTCRFFLRRACHREDCPYSHVNVGRDAEICLDFLRGYCTNGDSCKKKHMLICSDFSDSGTCPRGNSCPMRHQKKKQQKLDVNKVAEIERPTSADKSECVASTAKDYRQSPVKPSLSDDDDVTLEWKERRLPAFIALNNSVGDSVPPNGICSSDDSGKRKSLIIHPRLRMYDARIEEIDSIIQRSSQEL